MKASLFTLFLAGTFIVILSGCQSPDVIVINNPPSNESKPATVTKSRTVPAPAPAPRKSDPTTIEPVRPPQTFSQP